MSAHNDLDEYQRHALDVARGLVRAGVPIFAAHPDPSRGVGFALPRGWETTDATHSLRAIDGWRPGMALCAVMGHTLDLIDFDPHNGTPGEVPFGWPTAYATADTPSGGRHAFVAALRVGSRDNILPGVDVKGGRPDGTGHGFAFIAPTVRTSKVDGSRRGYVWTYEPDVESLAALASLDHSGEQLAHFVAGKLSSSSGSGVRANGSAPTIPTPVPAWAGASQELAVFRAPARTFTYREAIEFCRPAIERLRAAPDGTRNSTLNEAAKVLSHFVDVPGFWSSEQAVEWLTEAIPPKTPGTGRRAWDARATIASAFRSAQRDWRAEHIEEGARFPSSTTSASVARGGLNGAQLVVRSRWVDLAPYLDGSYVPPSPSVGAVREDGAQLLYPGAWHTLIGTTGAGKTWLALAHARDELLRLDGRGHVVYAHFEESSPPRTLDRLLALGLAPERIRERFHWYDTNESNAPGEFAAWLAHLPAVPTLVVLDGINSACTTHQQDPQAVASVGWYRKMFVTPATALGAAVLSLGHPVKAKERVGERHGFGSTAWLDEADGVGFRLESKTGEPIRRGATGVAYLSSVKDRYGQVELHGRPDQRDGWHFLGTIIVDSATDPSGKRTGIRFVAPKPGEREATEQLDPIMVLAGEIERVLQGRENRAYETQAELEDWLYEKGVRFQKTNMNGALGELVGRGRLVRDPATGVGRSRGGCLIGNDSELAAEATDNV